MWSGLRRLVLLLMLFALVGCAGSNCVNTVRINTVPSGGKVYANGAYIGEAPVSIPAKCWQLPPGGETTALRIEKQGYRTQARSIPWAELYQRYVQHDGAASSEFGNGWTFPYTFNLEPLENTPLKVETAVKSVDVLIKGYSSGGKSRQQDYQEALLNAKLQAIERAGVDISSYTKVENFMIKHDLVESKAQALLEPGFQVIDMGYQSDGSFLVILSGKVTISKISK